jgi:hypothetical protein
MQWPVVPRGHDGRFHREARVRVEQSLEHAQRRARRREGELWVQRQDHQLLDALRLHGLDGIFGERLPVAHRDEGARIDASVSERRPERLRLRLDRR